MKKYMLGFAPVYFKKSGIILLIIGLICLVLKFIDYLTDWFNFPNYVFYFGIGLILISLYLILLRKIKDVRI